jgi:hypothetical protein
MKITPPEQVAWFKTILEGKASYLRFAKQTINRPEVIEIAQTDYDCAEAVMATLLNNALPYGGVRKDRK